MLITKLFEGNMPLFQNYICRVSILTQYIMFPGPTCGPSDYSLCLSHGEFAEPNLGGAARSAAKHV